MWSTAILLALPALSLAGGHSCDRVGRGFVCQPEISHFWGEYSPYFSVPSKISSSTPSGCNITFANLLSRHGTRTPTNTGNGAVVQQIQSQTTNYSSQYAFIKNYNYTLGDEGVLTYFGQVQMMQSGIQFFQRYPALAMNNTPFIRSSSDPRVVESAQNWTQGFHQALLSAGGSDPAYPYNILVISEDVGVNSTLFAQQACTLYNEKPYSKINNYAETTWLSEWSGPVVSRVNDNLQGANINSSALIYLMELCPFQTTSNRLGHLSPFCGLFNTTEWSYFSYYRDVDKWYEDFQGNPLGPATGVGYVSELLARMTNNRTYVQDASSYSSVNHTMDDSNDTFPLNYPLFADFTHDDNIASILAAMGLYNATADLSNTTYATAQQDNGYSTPWVIPLGSRTWFEKMTCEGKSEELVRVVNNDRVVPLQNCGADKLGRCTLSNFVASQTFTTDGGQWEMCY